MLFLDTTHEILLFQKCSYITIHELNTCSTNIVFSEDPVSPSGSANIQYSPIRQRERTNSKRLSFTEQETEADIYEDVQNLDLSERNDSASSVASFAEAQEGSEKHLNKKNLQCKVCSRSFRSFKTLNQHLRLHMPQSYKCNTCGKIFTLKKSYQRHIKSHKIHEADRMFECGICDKSFADLNSWKRHRMCHMDVRKYSCNLCGKAFYEKYSLKVHQTSHFYPTFRADRNIDIDSKFSCHICGKLLKSRTAMKNHMLTHSAKKFTCEFCNKRFSQKYSYIRHRRIHTGEKPYKCGECERSFSDGSAWSKHIKTHTGIKPYSCDLCSKSFFDKTLCKTHMKTHKGKKTYKHTDDDKKRDFKILSEGRPAVAANKAYIGSSNKMSYDIDTSASLYDNGVNLHLGLSDKESDDDSHLLDSGFATDHLPTEEDKNITAKDTNTDKKVTSIVESIVLDEKFQSDFVERNMPSKPIESDNELITSAFNEDFDILDEETEADILDEETEAEILEDETEVEMQHSVLSDPVFKEKQDLTRTDKPEDFWHKKTRQRRSMRGKVFPESPAKCKICHKKFKQESLLKQHLQFHCMSKLYKCRFCGKQLSTKHSLIRHERIHVGDRPYQCYICQKTFADNYDCIRHINTHFNKESKGTNRSSTRSSYKPSEQISYEANSKYESHDRNFNNVCISPTISSQADSHVQPSKSCEASCINLVQSDGISKLQTNLSIDSGKNSSNKELKVSPAASAPSTITTKENLCKETHTPLGKKHLYKCFKCAHLFVSEKLCIDHITQTCSKQELSASELVVSQSVTGKSVVGAVDHLSTNTGSNNTVQSASKNLFQCASCLLMFEDKSACERHIADKCEKSKVDTDCAVQSILEEPFTEPDLESLPRLPFPEVSDSNSYLDIADSQVLLLSDNSVSSDMIASASTKLLSENSKPATSSKLPSGGNVTLSFIPFSQMSSQAPPGVTLSPGIQSTKQPSPDSNFTALLQKPAGSVGSNKFIIANQGINFVGQSSADNIIKTATQSKKKQGEKKEDIEERTCTICNKVFTTKHILKQHTLIHMERKYECKYCMKKFHNKYGRDRHERIHTGEKPFSCPYCRKAFADNSTYRKHTRSCVSAK